jgi:hypothetical protein
MGFSAMLAEEYKLVDISLISFIMARLFFATSTKVYSASAFLFIFSNRAGRDTEYQHSRKPWPLAVTVLEISLLFKKPDRIKFHGNKFTY